MRTWPALFTTTSTVPNASRAAPTMAAPPSGVAMVSRFATAVPPAATISATTSSAGGDVGAAGHAVGVADPDPEVIDQHLRATRGEQEGVLATEVAPRAGDDDDLPVEPQLAARRDTRLATLTHLPAPDASGAGPLGPRSLLGGIPPRDAHSSVYTGVRPSFQAAIFSSKLPVVMRT